MVYIYSLLLEENKYYIGKTQNPSIRLNTHFDMNGSSWTRKYKPVKILEIIPNCDAFDEDKYTKKYMSRYGINNVRGGSYCQLTLPKTILSSLHRELHTAKDTCFGCGKDSHFIANCPENNAKEVFINNCKQYTQSDRLPLNIIHTCLKNTEIFSDMTREDLIGYCSDLGIIHSKIINYNTLIDGLCTILLNNDDDSDSESESELIDVELELNRAKKVFISECEKYNAPWLPPTMVYNALKNSGVLFSDITQADFYSYCRELRITPSKINNYHELIDGICTIVLNMVNEYENGIYETDSDCEMWTCDYCDKEFTTLKGCRFHENLYCKEK